MTNWQQRNRFSLELVNHSVFVSISITCREWIFHLERNKSSVEDYPQHNTECRDANLDNPWDSNARMDEERPGRDISMGDCTYTLGIFKRLVRTSEHVLSTEKELTIQGWDQSTSRSFRWRWECLALCPKRIIDWVSHLILWNILRTMFSEIAVEK